VLLTRTAGKPGELGHPDKGIYEPHLYILNNGSLSVMYANEKHVIENPLIQPNYFSKDIS
jgi:hypothetical protein